MEDDGRTLDILPCVYYQKPRPPPWQCHISAQPSHTPPQLSHILASIHHNHSLATQHPSLATSHPVLAAPHPSFATTHPLLCYAQIHHAPSSVTYPLLSYNIYQHSYAAPPPQLRHIPSQLRRTPPQLRHILAHLRRTPSLQLRHIPAIKNDFFEPVPNLHSLALHCNENPLYAFLFWGLRGLSPNFHIHVSVKRFIF